MFVINQKDAFNDFFTNIDQKLANQIPKSSIKRLRHISVNEMP